MKEGRLIIVIKLVYSSTWVHTHGLKQVLNLIWDVYGMVL
jgi:hypothetical protein